MTIWSIFRCCANDRIESAATLVHREFGLNIIVRVVFHNFPQSVLATLAKPWADLPIVSLSGNILGVRISRSLDDMLRHQLGSLMLRQGQRIVIRPYRELRDVNGIKDEVNFQHD